MSIILAVLFLIMGLVGVFRPSFFYKSELLTAQQIERNKRIWKKGGAALVILGLALFAINFFV